MKASTSSSLLDRVVTLFVELVSQIGKKIDRMIKKKKNRNYHSQHYHEKQFHENHQEQQLNEKSHYRTHFVTFPSKRYTFISKRSHF